MVNNIRQKLKWIDWVILIPTLILILIGIVMVYSAGSYTAVVNFDNQNHYLIRQTIFAVLGLFLLGFTYLMNIKFFKNGRIIQFVTMATLLSLILVLLIGTEVNGARAWLGFGSFNIQPAEVAKLTIIWYLSYYFSKKQNQLVSNIDDFLETMKSPIILVGIMLLLILFQPDVGSVFIISVIVFVMVIASGTTLKMVGFLVFCLFLLLALGTGVLYFFGDAIPFIQGYQMERIEAFIDPFKYAQTSGLQLINSYYALSRGGLFGVGLGNSVQKTGYLPEPQTDFIMAIVGEELGLVGVLAILVIITFLIGRIYHNAIKSPSTFNALINIGIATMFLIQIVVNIGGVTGLLPITGVTFPFISYGGSSLLINCVSIGIVLNAKSNDMRYLERQSYERSEK